MPQPGSADVQADAGQPGAEPLGSPQAIEAEQRLEGGVLRRVARQIRGAERPPTERQQQPAMPVEQFSERCLVAATGAPDQRGIASAAFGLHLAGIV